MAKSKAQVFNDGIVKIYEVKNIEDDGNRPKKGLSLKRILRYKERTLGFSRYYAAGQANVQIDMLVRCQLQRDISSQDIAVPNSGDQYRILRIQKPEDVIPAVMDMELQKVVQKYEFA